MSTNGQRAVGITGTGAYLPERILSNAELEKMVETSNEWILTRTGISERRIAGDDQATSDLGALAAGRALERAGVAAADVDMIITATITPDMVFPNTSCFIQNRIGAKKAVCFDVEAACAGFVYGLEVARQFVASGAMQTVLVIGAEKLSTITDWKDRTTCVLFGDGAGAAVVQPQEVGRGILSSVMGSDGALAELLRTPGGGSRHPATHDTVDARMHYIKMEGKEVFKHAVRCMADSCTQALSRAGVGIDAIRWIVPHQANMRIISAIADRLGVGMERMVVNLERVGNMSSASVPVALDERVREGRVAKGDLLLFVAFGGGFTWGATVLEWGY